MRIHLLFVISLILLASCATNNRDAARNFAMGGVIADLVTTHQALDRGCIEANPILGKDASFDRVAAANIPILWLIYEAAKRIEVPDWLLWSMGGFRWIVAGSNARQNCRKTY